MMTTTAARKIAARAIAVPKCASAMIAIAETVVPKSESVMIAVRVIAVRKTAVLRPVTAMTADPVRGARLVADLVDLDRAALAPEDLEVDLEMDLAAVLAVDLAVKADAVTAALNSALRPKCADEWANLVRQPACAAVSA